MNPPIEPARRVELGPPSWGETVRATGVRRVRLILDKVLHRPPSSRTFQNGTPADSHEMLGLSWSEFDALWQEACRTRLEDRISDRLRNRFPKGAPVQLIATPEGEWLDILRFIYVIIRASKPVQAVETGVGPVGASTSFILEAMRANDEGHLWSLDVGHYLALHSVEPGNGIPDELRDRHTLLIASARNQLHRVVNQCAPVGFFLHDSEHTYANMMFEFSVVWPQLASAGVVLADDARNDAPDRFAAKVGIVPRFLNYGGTPFGVLRKP